MNKTLWTLVAKDLRLHGLPLVLLMASVLASCALTATLRRIPTWSQGSCST